MYSICVFAGTTEGRELVEFLSRQPVFVTACVATEYGEALLKLSDNLTVISKRLPADEMIGLLQEQQFDLVIDATHPYAVSVTAGIKHACETTCTEYLRLLREETERFPDAIYVPDTGAAVDFLSNTEGNILLTTGSKELHKYAAIKGFADRVYARVLPMTSSLEACRAAGLKPSRVIAMQGPFSEEMNVAMLRFMSAKWLVTKDGGEAGGFAEKAAAARTAGARLVVIGRPPEQEGMAFSEIIALLCRRFGCQWKPRVSVVGIGPGNPDTMTREVRETIERADCLIGAKRMLAAIAAPEQRKFEAISPEKIAGLIKRHPEYRHFTVLMSGDVGFFSGSKKLLPLLDSYEVEVLPGVSSLAYLCARLKTAYEDVIPVSIHGRENNLVPYIQANPRVFVLVGGENGMGQLCRTLVDAGLGQVKMSIGERLSYPDEKITKGTAAELVDGVYDSLCVALVENEAADAIVTHGLPDCLFLRKTGEDGVVPMTKSEVRSVCLSKLELTERAICWDIGAGTGSVAVEMALQAKKGHVYAIEQKDVAIGLLRQNKKLFGAGNLTVVGGSAPEACRDLPAPTHVFVGGSSGKMREILALILAKNPGARIVATAITLESIGELIACLTEFPFAETEIVSVSIARAETAGDYHLMTGQNPVYIFTMQAKGGKYYGKKHHDSGHHVQCRQESFGGGTVPHFQTGRLSRRTL